MLLLVVVFIVVMCNSGCGLVWIVVVGGVCVIIVDVVVVK